MDKEQEEKLLNKIKQNQKNKKSYNDISEQELLDTIPNLKALRDSIDHIALPLREIQSTGEKYRQLFKSIDNIALPLRNFQALENINILAKTIFPPKISRTFELIQKQHINVFMDLYKINVHITNIRKYSTIITNEEVEFISQTIDEKDNIIVNQQNEINRLKKELAKLKSQGEEPRLEQKNQDNLLTNEMLKLVVQQNNYLINEVKELRAKIETSEYNQVNCLEDKSTEQKNIIPQEILNLSDTYQESYKIIALYPYKTIVQLADKRNIAEPTMKDHIEEICKALDIDNGITKLREYLNKKTSKMEG